MVCPYSLSVPGGVQAQVGQIENRLQYAVALAQSQVVNAQAADAVAPGGIVFV